MEEFKRRMESARFDFNDFLQQFERINNMGGLKMLKLMPGFNQVSEKQLYEVEKKFKMYSALISSMTTEVRGKWGALRKGSCLMPLHLYMCTCECVCPSVLAHDGVCLYADTL